MKINIVEVKGYLNGIKADKDCRERERNIAGINEDEDCRGREGFR